MVFVKSKTATIAYTAVALRMRGINMQLHELSQISEVHLIAMSSPPPSLVMHSQLDQSFKNTSLRDSRFVCHPSSNSKCETEQPEASSSSAQTSRQPLLTLLFRPDATNLRPDAVVGTTSTANNNFTWACPMVGAGKGNNTRKITPYLVHL